MANGFAGTIEDERFMSLHIGRILSRRQSYAKSGARAVPDAAESLIRKLEKEIARGHETVAFLIAISFGLLKDFGVDLLKIIIKVMVGASAGNVARWISWGADMLGYIPFKLTGVGIVIQGGLMAISSGSELVADAQAKTATQAVEITFIAISLMISGGLFLFMWGKGWFLSNKIRFAWWGLGFFVDNLPLVSMLPLTTLSLMYAHHNVKKRAKAAEKKLADFNKLTQDEIENLDNDISLLDKED